MATGNSARPLADYITIRGRYRKSVHLERDWDADQALAGYVVTALVRSVLSRLARGLSKDAQQRAWSVTGPYGTGKSALAVFWADLLSEPTQKHAQAARKILRAANSELAAELLNAKGPIGKNCAFVTVLATGERAGLDLVLLRALLRALEQFWSVRPGARPGVLRSVRAAIRRAERGHRVGVKEVVSLFETAATKVRAAAQPAAGLVVVLDEAGKCLEYAAQEPTRGDVHLLQELAESANRSGDCPILFITILHQAIERYAGRLGAAQRNEWAKVQGRFEDIAFQEDTDQLLNLVAAALEVKRALPRKLAAQYERLAEQVATEASRGDAQVSEQLAYQLKQLFPLHPATGLVLGPLFRSRLAQNERSLFSFLCSAEPVGFQEHLRQPLKNKDARLNLYTIDQLYDYVVNALGTQLYGHDGRVWAEIDTALRRVPRDAEQLDARALKTIGLLSVVGDQAGLRPSAKLLELALADGEDATRRAVAAGIDRLTAASAVVFRKYRDAYQIWEGSDIDLDELLHAAFDQTDTRAGLARRLMSLVPPRPIVARRHLFRTGTLRFFDVHYVEADALEESMSRFASTEADGVVFVVLPRAGGDVGYVRELAGQKMLWFTRMSDDMKPAVVGIPQNASHLSDLAAELAALEWVQANTPDLARDPVARRELTARLEEAERLVVEEMSRLVDGTSGSGCDWYYRGEILPAKTGSELGRALSDICDSVYYKAPVVHNELLNRRQLSSSAAAARRNLLEAMLLHGDQNRLGFEGYPPEVSMYRSVLERHRLHRDTKHGWRLGAPTLRGPGTLRDAWTAVQQFLASTEESRRTVAELYNVLRAPPYGMKDGVLPVLLVAVFVDLESEIAIYEGGAFVPGLSVPVIERLLRWPEKFELQRFKIAGVRAKVFERFGRALLHGEEADRPSLLAIVRSLVQFVADLPDYARITREVSETAQRVRAILLRAKEPGPMLFRDLPSACGCKTFETSKRASSGEVELFFENLRAALGELQTAYPRLLSDVESHLRAAFDLPKKRGALAAGLGARAQRLSELGADAELKAFLLRATDSDLRGEDWLSSVATFLASKPPPKWNDGDLDVFQVKTARVARKFKALESLAVQLNKTSDSGDQRLIRLAIAQPEFPEVERVVSVPSEDADEVERLRKQLLRALGRPGKAVQPHAALAALADAARVVIEESCVDAEPIHPRHDA